MSLSKFEEFVIKHKLTPDLSVTNAIFVYGGLKSRCVDAYEDIRLDISLALDENKQLDLMADENIWQHAKNHNNACMKSLNKHIQQALNNIEDKQSEHYEEDCCITAFKRDRESRQ